MEWHIVLKISDPGFSINHGDQILALGSCFSQEIGGCLEDSKFRININPFGTLYHPEAIARVLEYGLGRQQWHPEYATRQQDVWYSWHHHGKVSSLSEEGLQRHIEKIHSELIASLKKTRIIMITPGTAWGYNLKSSNQVVANCHKAPAQIFEKIMMPPESVSACFQKMIDNVREQFPEIKFVFTVSPVRHLRDGFHENQLSKSSLLLGIQEIVEQNEDVYYFPSYEIMLDELRDYRFYAADKIHPSEEAIHYIWKRFRSWCMNETTEMLIQEINALQAQLRHKAFHTETPQYKLFKERLMTQLDKLTDKYPEIDWGKEMERVGKM
jgi:hypothetical protein